MKTQDFIKLRKIYEEKAAEAINRNPLNEYFSFVKYLFLINFVDNNIADKLLENKN